MLRSATRDLDDGAGIRAGNGGTGDGRRDVLELPREEQGEDHGEDADDQAKSA